MLSRNQGRQLVRSVDGLPAPFSFFDAMSKRAAKTDALTDANSDLRLFSIRAAAELLGLNYFTLFRRVAVVKDLSDPLPCGKTIRAVLLSVTPRATSACKRIPASEIRRVSMGGAPC